MKDFILEKLKTLKVSDNKKLEEYIDFCFNNSTEYEKSKTQLHHILPRSLFKEYIKISENIWNGVHLTNDNHYIAHFLLHQAVEDISIASSWYAMNNKNYKLGEPLTLIGSENYALAIEKRNELVSNNAKDKVIAKCLKTNKNLKVSKEEFDNNDNLVGATKGKYTGKLKNTVSVYLKDDFYNIFRINKDDFDVNIHESVLKNAVIAKDKDNNRVRVHKDDIRLKTGELTGLNKNIKITEEQKIKTKETIKKNGGRSGSKNSNAKIIVVFDSFDNPMYFSHANFETVCKREDLPFNLLKKTIKNNNIITIDNKPKWVATKYKNRGLMKFIGWYAREMKRINLKKEKL